MVVEFQSVVSSNISRVAYDEAESALYVEFKNGGRYKYTRVPHDDYEGLLNASSPGRYFHDNIKDIYPAQRV